MSKMFICGSFSCNIIIIDDDAISKVATERQKWATLQKNLTGKFPSETKQIEYVKNAYERHTKIHLC